ncbi:MAG: DUF302 domain-containing protein [Sulfurimonas sp.]
MNCFIFYAKLFYLNQGSTMKKLILTLLLLLSPLMADGIYKLTLNQKADVVYTKLLASLDNNHLIIVSEINILEKFKHAGLPEKFGKEFNSNNLTTIKAIIACNGFFGNYIANADPDMMGLCPIRLTIVEKNGKTTILFVKPTNVGSTSRAKGMIEKLEKKVISAIEAVK